MTSQEREHANWIRKGAALVQKWIDDGYTFEQIGYGITNRGFVYRIAGDTFELHTYEKFPRTKLVGTFTR